MYSAKKWMTFLAYLVFSYLAFITIETHAVSKMVRFQVTGTTNLVKKNILRHLRTLDHNTFQQDEVALNYQVLRSKKSIYSILQAHGYFKPRIQVNIQKSRQGLQVNYHIDPGPVLFISKIHIQLLGEGKKDKKLETLVQILIKKRNQPMSTENYQNLKRNLYKGVISKGYINAQWEKNVVDVDLKHYSSTITLIIDTKTQYTVKSIQLAKNPIDRKLLKKLLPYSKGSPYQLQDIFQAETQLKNLGYFQEVFTQLPARIPSSQIPLFIHLKAAAPFHHKMGIRIGTGLVYALEGELFARYLNSQGHQAGIMGHISNTNQKVLGIYTIPSFQSNFQAYHIQGVLEKQSLDSLGTCYQQFILNSTKLSFNSHLNHFLKIHRECVPQGDQLADFISYFFIGGFSLEHTRFNWFQARHNYKVYFNIQAALKPIFSEVSFLKPELQADYFLYLAPWVKQSYLIFRTRLGFLHTNAIEKLPLSFNFYAGGDEYPRGYTKYKLQKYLTIFSAEYRQLLIGAFYLTPFIDVSYERNVQPNPFKISSGISLLLWIPTIGQLEISWVKKHSTSDTVSSNTHWTGRVSMRDI